MQGYGSTGHPPTTGRRTRRPLRLAAAALAAAALTATSACGLLEEQQGPTAIQIPERNALITESSTAAPTATTAPKSRSTRSFTTDAADSMASAISTAPRVGVSNYHVGATTDTGERLDDLSGVHFSTPDRTIRCSTGNNGSGALVCAGDRIDGRTTPPPNSPAGCEWNRNLAVLNSESVAAGGCANLYPVLFRSHILEFGSTIVAGGFSCLSDVDGLYCLESDSNAGFALTSDGYAEIHGDDRAPSELLGESARNSQRSTAPTPTR